ncbi:hypothetical protein J6590_011771 [Homalodisca vitripennis]|nr:hypothetical protein J6590_011771 [Homalodisca vitripennis]
MTFKTESTDRECCSHAGTFKTGSLIVTADTSKRSPLSDISDPHYTELSALCCPSSWVTELCKNINKQNEEKSRNRTRSIVLRYRIYTRANSNSNAQFPRFRILGHRYPQ